MSTRRLWPFFSTMLVGRTKMRNSTISPGESQRRSSWAYRVID